MKLKLGTILDFYTHKNTNILCQIKVQPSKENKQQHREWKNTCRCLTQEQWYRFDKEIKIIFKALRDKRDPWKDGIISTFSIKPNIEVKVQKAKLSSKMFYNVIGGVDESESAEDSIDNNMKNQQIDCVLEFTLDFKPQPPSILPVKETQEYQPETTTSTDNTCISPDERYTTSKKKYQVKSLKKETQKYEPTPKTSCNNPPSYEPYTPTKKNYQANSLEQATQKYESNPKTSPDDIINSHLSYEPYTLSKKKCRVKSLDGIRRTSSVDFLENESFEDVYLPKSIKNTTKTDHPIPAYKPAPINEKRSSNDSQTLNHSSKQNEVIADQDDDLLSPVKFKTKRSKVLMEKAKHEIEYIPKSQEIIIAPAYFPTPIEGKNTIKNDSQDEKKINKFTNKDNKQFIETLNPENPTQLVAKQAKKENCNNSQKDERKRICKRLDHTEKLSSKGSKRDNIAIIEILESGEEDIPENVLNVSESTTTDVVPPNKNTKEQNKFSHHDTERSKPKRLREEQSCKEKNKKKFKTQNTSPTNKELFGTDCEDDDDKGVNSNSNHTTNQKSSLLHSNGKILKNPHR